jgi:hypothetical protein
MPDYPNFAGKALFKDVTEPASPDSGNLAVYSESGVLKTKTSGGTVTSLGAAPSNMVGATSSTAGTAGLVPAPTAGKNTRALFSNASFEEVPIVPSYKNTTSGQYILPYAGNATGLTTMLDKVRRFTLVFVPADGSIDVLGYRTANAPTSSIDFHIALWECDEDGKPSTLVTSGVGASGTTGAADISVSVSSSAVKRGFYYISLTPNGSTSSGAIRGSTGAELFIYGLFLGNSSLSAGGQIFTYTATTYNQSTHETFSITTNQAPYVGFQYA